MKKEPSYYSILPAEIRYDNRLSSSEKLFYAEVTALTNKTGECWASRKYFAELYDVAESTVTSWTNSLCKHGYIDVDYEYDGKQIKKRSIKILNTCGLHVFEGGQNIDQGGQKTELGVVRKPEGGWSENRTDNTTSINTTSNNKEAEEIYKLYPRLVGKKKAIKKIEKAFDDMPPDKLKAKVKEYANAVRGKEKKYIPHPATWFNQGRYFDDPKEWRVEGQQSNGLDNNLIRKYGAS